MTYVNYRGEEIGLVHHEVMKKSKKEQAAEYHNGWRVQGIPPGALEEARADHRRKALLVSKHTGNAAKEWDEERWLMNAKRKAVRSKPYEVPEAAQECKALAEKSGWLRVEVVELKKEKSAA